MHQNRFISFDGTGISWRMQGPEGAPIVVLLNGLTCDACYWPHVIRDLTRDHRVLTWDYRGHGLSDPPTDPRNTRIGDLARDLSGLLDHLGIDRATLAAFSMGVEVMLELACQRASSCRALMAICGTYTHPFGGLYENRIPAWAWRISMGSVARLAPRPVSVVWKLAFRLPVRHLVASSIGATAASEPELRPYYDHQQVLDVPTVLRIGASATRHSVKPWLGGVRCPVLVVAGTRDRFTPLHFSQEMRDALPDVDYVEIEGVTHTALLEVPDRINAEMRRFLAGVEARE